MKIIEGALSYNSNNTFIKVFQKLLNKNLIDNDGYFLNYKNKRYGNGKDPDINIINKTMWIPLERYNGLDIWDVFVPYETDGWVCQFDVKTNIIEGICKNKYWKLSIVAWGALLYNSNGVFAKELYDEFKEANNKCIQFTTFIEFVERAYLLFSKKQPKRKASIQYILKNLEKFEEEIENVVSK